MRQEIKVRRTLPVNLLPKDLPLFEGALDCCFERFHPVHLKHVCIIQDTIFSPGELKFYSDYTHIAKLGFLQLAKRVVYCAPKSWRKIPKGMWVIDEWSANYFHWMTDCLPRIWEGLDRDPQCPVLLPESFRSCPYVIESLKLIGVEVGFFHYFENLMVDHLILTTRTAIFPNFNEVLTRRTRDFFSVFHQESTPHLNVYVSRKLATKRKAHNEPEVELMLRKRGFEIVYAEHLTFRQQVELMGKTKLLVCLHGAALTNMLFLKKEAKVLELRNIGDSKTQCYFNLASTLELPYFYTLNKGDDQDTIITNFTIDLAALESAIELIV